MVIGVILVLGVLVLSLVVSAEFKRDNEHVPILLHKTKVCYVPVKRRILEIATLRSPVVSSTKF